MNLFSEVKNTKHQGNIGLAAAIKYFVVNGYTVSIPINDSQDYDLIVEEEGILHRVQVKTTSYKAPSGAFQVNLRSTGGTKGTVYKRVNKDNSDLLFILCSDNSKFIIPLVEITNTSTINLSFDYIKYKV